MEYKIIVDIVFLLGILFILHFIYLLILSKQTSRWLPIESIIDTSELEVTNQGLGNENSVLYKANVKYQYVIEEKVYFSKRVFIGDYLRKSFPRNAKLIVSKYKKGETVLAYYNPQRPNKSVLETGIHTAIYSELFVGVFFIVLSVIMWNEILK